MSQETDINLEIAQIKNLPTLPEESIRIITAVNNPDISIDELVKVISASPTLTARLLGLANSAYFGRSIPVNNLRRAIIQVLGLNLVKSLALSIVLNVALDTSKCKLFDSNLFWSHALITATIAQKLAVHFNDDVITPNTVYTSGLLLNIGLIAAIYINPEKINDIFEMSDRLESSVSKQMYQQLGLTQYQLGGILLEKWKLPEIYHTTVKEFRQPDFKGQEMGLIKLLELCHWVGYCIVTDKHEDMPDFSDLLNSLSLNKDTFENVVIDIINNKDNISELASVISE